VAGRHLRARPRHLAGARIWARGARARAQQLHLRPILGPRLSGELDDQPVEYEAPGSGGLQATFVAFHEALRLELGNALLIKGTNVDRREPLDVDSLDEAQAHQQIFVCRLLRTQGLVMLDAVTLCCDGIEPGFGRLAHGDGVLDAASRDAAMRARPDPNIVMAAPINEIMPRLCSRTRVVRHLV